MTTASNTFGRPPIYPFRAMAVGDSIELPAPSPADVKRIARNASQYGLRTDRFYSCKTDRARRVTTVTRVR